MPGRFAGAISDGFIALDNLPDPVMLWGIFKREMLSLIQGIYNQLAPHPFSLLCPKMKLTFLKSIQTAINGKELFLILNKKRGFSFYF